MEIKLEWLDGARNACLEEKATICYMQIYVNNINVCQSVDIEDKKEYDWICIAAVRLAEGIADNWDKIFSGEACHLRYYRCGYLIPDMELKAVDGYLEIKVVPYTYDNPGTIFTKNAYEKVPVQNAKMVLAEFVQDVILKLDGSVYSNDDCFSTDLNIIWSNLIESAFYDRGKYKDFELMTNKIGMATI